MTRLADAIAAGRPIMRPSDPVNEHFAKIERRKPRLKQAYRACDQDDLRRLAQQVIDEDRLRQLTPAERQKVAAELAVEVERHFPPAKMQVLAEFTSSKQKAVSRECYQCAYPRSELWIGYERFILPWHPLAPEAWAGFTIDAASWPHTAAPPLAAAFAARARAIEIEDRAFLTAVTAWPFNFKRAHKRYPTWGEIAAEFRRLAARIGAPSLPHPTDAAR